MNFKQFIKEKFQKYKIFLKKKNNQVKNIKILKILIYIIYPIIFLFSFTEVIIRSFLFEKNLHYKFFPFSSRFKKSFIFSPLLLYRYLPNSSKPGLTIFPEYKSSGNKKKELGEVGEIKNLIYKFDGYHKINEYGRPAVVVAKDSIYYEKNNLHEAKNDNNVFKSKKKISIIITGGSTVAGSGVNNNEESLPSKLQEVLGNDFEVQNFGVGGYSTFDEFIYVWSDSVDCDLIIHYTGWNTLAYSAIFTGTSIDSHISKNFFSTNEAHLELQLFVKDYISIGFIGIDRRSLNNFISKSLIYRLFYPIFKIFFSDAIYLGGVRTYTPQNYLNFKEAAQSACRSLIASYYLAKKEKKKFLVVIQPTILDKKKLHPIEKYIWDNPTSSWKNNIENLTIIKNYFKELREEISKNNIPCLDLTNLFQENNDWIFTDEIHINVHGNFQIAKKIAQKIFETLEV